MTRVLVLPQADADIDEAADEYVRVEDIELGLRFYDAVERTWAELAEHPEVGASVQWDSARLSGIRRWQVANPFSVHQIYYRVTQDVVIVYRVLHGARDNERALPDPSSSP